MAGRNAADRWIVPACVAVTAITAARVVLLILGGTDLHTVEAEVWIWAQSPAQAPFPLTAWLVRGTTLFAAEEWAIRLPAPILHGATAMILGSVAGRLFGSGVALATVLAYVTLPGVALGSLMLTPITMAAPFAAAALALYLRLLDGQDRRVAVAVGVTLGLAVLAHPAAMLLALCALPAGLQFREARPHPGNGLALAGAFALSLLPFLVLSAVHGGWFASGPAPDLATIAWLPVWLVAVPGPVLLIAGAAAALRWRRQSPLALFLLIYTIPPLSLGVLLTLAGFGAAWPAAAVLAGVPLAVSWLRLRPRVLWLAAAAINLTASVALPIATLMPERLGPAMAPLTGRTEQGRTVLDIARDLRVGAIVVGDRQMLADLTYTARDRPVTLYAAPGLTGGPARVMRFEPGTADVLLVLPKDIAPPCPEEVMDLADMTPDTGAYRNTPQMLYLIPGQCLG